jgi:hypothetical protein
VAMASIGSGPPTLINISSGETTSLATLTAGGLAFGEMSAGHGATSESLTYWARRISASSPLRPKN